MSEEIQTVESDNEPDGMVAAAIATAKGEWPHSFDAQEWARQWAEHIKEHPGIPYDEGTMIGWFANALMAGYDRAMVDIQKM